MGEQVWKQRNCERKKKVRDTNPEAVREKQGQNLCRWQAAKKEAAVPQTPQQQLHMQSHLVCAMQ